MGCLFMQKGVLVWICLLSMRFICGYSEAIASQGTVYVDGKSAIGRIDRHYICATLDWWPPEKCDYGTCAWDHASFLNLEEIEVESKVLRVGKTIAVVTVELRKKETGKIVAQGRHTKYLVVNSKL